MIKVISSELLFGDTDCVDTDLACAYVPSQVFNGDNCTSNDDAFDAILAVFPRAINDITQSHNIGELFKKLRR